MTATVRAAGFAGYAGLVTALGGDPDALIRAYGVSRCDLDQGDLRIPFRDIIHALQHTATALDNPGFGLQLASGQDISILGPIAIAMQNSQTIAEAMDYCARFLFIQSPALSLQIHTLPKHTQLEIRFHLRNLSHADAEQIEGLTIGGAHRIFQLLAGDQYQLNGIKIPHTDKAIKRIYEQHFETDVITGSEANTLCVSNETMSASLVNSSEMMKKVALDYLNLQFTHCGSSISWRVEQAISKTLGTRSCNRDAIAAALAMHPRTLQRKLAVEDLSFDAIRDQLRKQRAQYYLCDTRMPLSQVAALLGYSEQAILTRSCHRWFEQSPRQLRSRSAQTV